MARRNRSSGTGSGSAESQDGLLKRELGFWHLTGIALGGVIGSGWLLAPVKAAQTLGSASVVAWVIGAIALVLPCVVLVELGVAAPLSGGLVRWPFHTSGSVVGAFAGWTVWIAYAINPPAEALAALQYINSHWTVLHPDGRPDVRGQLLGLVILLIFAALNWFGIRLFAQVNLALTTFKVVVPTLVAALFLVSALSGTAHGGGLPAHRGTADGILPAIVGAGIFFAYSGFQGPLDVAGEARSAKGDILRAIAMALAIPTVLYVVLQIAVLGVTGSGGGTGRANDLLDLAGGARLGWLAVPLAITAAVSTSGSAGVYITESSRAIFAMGRNRLLPEGLGKVHRASGIPRRAVLANLLLGIVILFTFRNWTTMVTVLGMLTLIGYSLSLVSARALSLTRPAAMTGSARRGRAAVPPPAVPPAGPARRIRVLAPAGFTVMTLLVYWASWGHLGRPAYAAGAGLALLALLAVVALTWLRTEARDPHDIRSAAWLVVHLGVLFLLAVFGHAGYRPVVPAPFDSLLAAAAGLGGYAWGLRSALAHLRGHGEEIDRLLGHAAAAGTPDASGPRTAETGAARA